MLLAQHIVGMNPKAIGSPEDPGEAPKVTVDEPATETAQQSQDSNDPEMEDHHIEAEAPPENNDTRLLYQDFLLDQDLTVKEWLAER